ncbi:MAG: hypothetical protein AAF907_17475, partial [Planctomycetota bacterium]
GAGVVVATNSSAGGPGSALAARDGFPLSNKDQALEVAARTIAVVGAGLVSVTEKDGGGYELRSWDPASGRTLWSRPVDSEDKIAVLPNAGPPVGLIVSPDDDDEDKLDDGLLVDLGDGEAARLGGVKAGGASLSAAADADRVFVVARPRRGTSRKYSIQRLPTLSLGETLDVFSRDGGLLWRSKPEGSEWLYPGLDQAQFVTLLTADKNAGRNELTEVEIAALDKQTGRVLMRTVVPVLTELEYSAFEPGGKVLHLWNDNRYNGRSREEHWRLRLTDAAEAPKPPEGDDVSQSAGPPVDRLTPRPPSPETLQRAAVQSEALQRFDRALDGRRPGGPALREVERVRDELRRRLETPRP